MRNKISEVICDDGQTVSDTEGIKKEAVRHFQEFLNQIPKDYESWPMEELENLISYRCDEMDNQLLVHEVKEEEIKRVLFSMPNEKSPGPDGFTVEFYKESWSELGKDMLVAIQSFSDLDSYQKG